MDEGEFRRRSAEGVDQLRVVKRVSVLPTALGEDAEREDTVVLEDATTSAESLLRGPTRVFNTMAEFREQQRDRQQA